MKWFRAAIVLFIASGFLLPIRPASARTRLARRIQIPAIGVDLPITVAPFHNTTWSFTRIHNQAAYLAGRPQPGQGGNVVIAAHSEFARRRPGPFYHLDTLKINPTGPMQRDSRTPMLESQFSCSAIVTYLPTFAD